MLSADQTRMRLPTAPSGSLPCGEVAAEFCWINQMEQVMETKHTPGPWFSPDGKTIKQDFTQIGLSQAAGCTIGAVMGGSTSGPHFIEINEEVAANAKLIAQAPSLLADLITAADTLRHYEAMRRAKGTDESTAKAEVNAELASRFESTIAKATA
jgi:hypothetical protein